MTNYVNGYPKNLIHNFNHNPLQIGAYVPAHEGLDENLQTMENDDEDEEQNEKKELKFRLMHQ